MPLAALSGLAKRDIYLVQRELDCPCIASLSRMMYTSLVYVYMSVIQRLHSVSGHPILAELGPGG